MCNNCNCRICDRLIISTDVAFAAGTLTITLPEGSYANGCKYCLIIAQAIPAATTITAPVVIAIGDGTVTYPLTDCRGVPVLAGGVRTRTRYPVSVATTATGGTFRLKARACCQAQQTVLEALTGDAPAATAAADGGEA